MSDSPVHLTQYSHGAGCSCKIAPTVLEAILKPASVIFEDPNLLVGNDTRDDAAIYDIGNGTAIISTTDFFMPIVDDPFDFGRIAATNAISDIYAMGGTPVMAVAILGWPVNILKASVARQMVEGGRYACQQAGIVLAGGHSIDAPEPIFGLAVTGRVLTHQIKRNSTASAGCRFWLSKPLGTGILTTAEKQRLLLPEHLNIARDTMCQLNRAGARLAEISGVHAMTDVTGFGLMGHLCEVCQGSQVRATVYFSAVPRLLGIEYYLSQGCVPSGSERNFKSYGHLLGEMDLLQRQLLCDPQTSGGLLIAADAEAEEAIKAVATHEKVTLSLIGELHELDNNYPLVTLFP